MTDVSYPLAGQRIFVAGHRGLVGSALVGQLKKSGAAIVTVERHTVDLMRQKDVEAFVADARPDSIVIAAAKVGGILANDTYPADFLYDNLMIAANLIHTAHQCNIDRLLYLGSSCVYPKFSPQPIEEGALLSGPLEPTNEAYAVAKIAGIKLCDAYRRQFGRHYISAMPTNLYGSNDNFDLNSSHVIPALIRKVHAATVARSDEVVIWGTGTPKREFMHVDDLADALDFLLERHDSPGPVNVGTGEEISIAELASLIGDVAGFDGRFTFDRSKPDGTPRKLLNSRQLRKMGWTAKISLRHGIEQVYRAYCALQTT